MPYRNQHTLQSVTARPAVDEIFKINVWLTRICCVINIFLSLLHFCTGRTTIALLHVLTSFAWFLTATKANKTLRLMEDLAVSRLEK